MIVAKTPIVAPFGAAPTREKAFGN